MTIIQLKIPVLSLVLRSKKQLETRKESAATEAVSSQWMKFLYSVQSTFPAGHIFHGMQSLLSEKIGDMSTEMVKEFFYAISYSCGMNLHIKVLTGGNSHHVAEAMFKSFAKALDQAVSYDPRITDVLSTKGSLA